MKLRPYAPGDKAALVEIWFDSWLSVGLERLAVSKADLANRFPVDLAERWDVTVAESNARPLGFLALALEERRLDQLFIAPDAQGQGVGKRLFETAKQKMPDGFWLATQFENMKARTFYERAGMTLERIETNSSGERAIYTFNRFLWST